MQTISFLNIKGGVGKTASAVNVAYILAAQHGQRVLLVDLDPQGHASLFYSARSYEARSVADVFGMPGGVAAARKNVLGDGTHAAGLLDILPADMRLVTKNREMLLDVNRTPRALKKALAEVEAEYDWCVMDYAPSIDMATINGLCASDWVLVPVTPDEFAADGLDILREQVETLRADWGAGVRILGAFFTAWRRSNAATDAVRSMAASGMPMMRSVIRATCRVPETERVHRPLADYAPRSTAEQDYEQLVREILEKVSAADMRR